MSKARILNSLVAEALDRITPRRKCFISYFSEDIDQVREFLKDYGDVFIPKEIGVSDADDFIDSTNTDYVMSKIRGIYLDDSTVTICMIGSCTHHRRYIDWELKSSLRQGNYTPNGLVGILLPGIKHHHLPPRFNDNWNEEDESFAYAILREYPKTEIELRSWIEEAFSRRSTHADLIVNSRLRLLNNRKCLIHKETH